MPITKIRARTDSDTRREEGRLEPELGLRGVWRQRDVAGVAREKTRGEMDHRERPDRLASDAEASISRFSRRSSLTALASASGLTPHSHKLVKIERVVRSRPVFRSWLISYKTSIVSAAFCAAASASDDILNDF